MNKFVDFTADWSHVLFESWRQKRNATHQRVVANTHDDTDSFTYNSSTHLSVSTCVTSYSAAVAATAAVWRHSLPSMTSIAKYWKQRSKLISNKTSLKTQTNWLQREYWPVLRWRRRAGHLMTDTGTDTHIHPQAYSQSHTHIFWQQAAEYNYSKKRNKFNIK